jgi:lipoprotein-anchoring transpeptidase ErfK/SrfK
MRQQRFLALICALALVAGADVADADVLISVNKTTQELTVSVDGSEHYKWPVSTARAGYVTPNGNYRPIRLDRKWFSRKYDNSPMPYSIFFHGGYAIHGSYERRSLGRPASHGCVRLDPKNAEKLFELVKAEGPDKTRIVVSGSASSVDRVEPRLTSSPDVSRGGR